MFDKNNDQKIDKQELKDELMKNAYYLKKTDDFYVNLIKEADLNGDGVIDYNEFKKMMEKDYDE